MPRLQPLLAPRSLAIIGASPHASSFGHDVVRVLLETGYKGVWHPVNPKYSFVEGKPCHASLGELPGPVDLAVACVGGKRMEALFDEAIATGTRALVIFVSCYVKDDYEPKLLQRLRDKARSAGLLVCVGNGMGFFNFDAYTHKSFEAPMNKHCGAITVLTHSGSVFVQLANHALRYRCNMVVFVGQEIRCTIADYLDYALEQDSTRVVALFMETVRDPAGFRQALEKANAKNIPVVVLKVGRTAQSAQLAATHSGAIAGNDSVFEALFERYGVVRVRSLDELLATATLLSQCASLGPGGVGAVTDSGGLCELLLDLAADIELPFASISDQTIEALVKRLPHGLEPFNPLDCAGPLTDDYAAVFHDCLETLLDDPNIALGLFEFDAQDRYLYMPEFVEIAKTVGKKSAKPLVVLNSLAGSFNHDLATDLASAGIPLINGASTCLQAVKGVFAYREFNNRPAAILSQQADHETIQRWRSRLVQGSALDEYEGPKLLSDFGIPTVPSRLAHSATEANQAARELTWPVTMKTAAQGVRHKTDVGGVYLNLWNEQALSEAYKELSAGLGERVIVQSMVEPGIELAFGMIRDQQFGPVVIVAAVGTLIEYVADRVVALAPFDEEETARLVSKLKIYTLLKGYRGNKSSNVGALLQCLCRFSILVDTLSDVLLSLDANPVI